MRDNDKDKVKSQLKTAKDNIRTVLSDYCVEYAKSNSSKCGVCETLIVKGDVRVGKKIYDTRRAKLNGPYDRWHHLKCFTENAQDLEYYNDGGDLPGISSLLGEDKTSVQSKIKGSKKRAAEDGVELTPSKKVARVD